jgi:ketosteroid isomerase-like protein
LVLRDTARAMSQENVELHHRCIDAFNRRDLNALLALMDDDVEAVSRLVAIEGTLKGHDGIRRWWKSWFDVWPDYNIEVVEVRDLGDGTLATLHALGHGAGSDVPFEDMAWQLARWRRGKCVLWRVFNDRAEALEAVGLSEQDTHADSP